MHTSNVKNLWAVSVLSLMLSFTGPVGATPDLSAIYCTELGYSFEIRTDEHGGTFGVCVFPDGSFCSSWAYFTECYLGELPGECHWPCQELPCKQAGQTVYIGECCEGLKQIQAAETYDDDCNQVGIGGPGPICSDCGNGICEPWESKCNCPLDCREPRIIYVDDDATGANDGSSWADAYNFLQDALTDANSFEKPVEIRVAQGIYTPDSNSAVPVGTGDREATFQLINWTGLMGGYAGSREPDPNARNIGLYEAILSADLSGNDVAVNDSFDLPDDPSRAENSYHVVTGSGTDSTAVLDGFTIAAGNANGNFESNDPRLRGGGMYNYYYSNPTLANCTFSSNSAGFGGGINNDRNSNPALTNCTFSQNHAQTSAGGMANLSASSPTLTCCTFTANSAEYYGGGMHNWFGSSPTLRDCRFSNNVAKWDGGGMRNKDWCDPTVTNCTFAGNSAWSYGAGMYNVNSSPTLTNCTFAANSASAGHALACDSYQHSSPSNLQLTNSILWDGGQEVWNNDNSRITITYSDVQYGRRWPWPGLGNIDTDPRFVDRINGDYHLKSQGGRWDANEGRWTKDDVTSPCIDAGNLMSPIGTEPFPNGGIINMGVYGGTAEASKSYFGEPVCEIIVAGDINGDCIVDWRDFSLMTLHWLEER